MALKYRLVNMAVDGRGGPTVAVVEAYDEAAPDKALFQATERIESAGDEDMAAFVKRLENRAKDFLAQAPTVSLRQRLEAALAGLTVSK